MSYTNAYIWDLEKWYRRTYVQGRNRDRDIENRQVGTVREREGGTNWEIRIEIHTHTHTHTHVLCCA